MVKKLIVIISVICLGVLFCKANDTYKEGDIVFQISKSKQSPYVAYATCSVWTHCGIIVYKDNKPYVLEASSKVKLTPLNDWINRGRFGIIKKRRVTESNIKFDYSEYLNKSYDLAFKFGNNKWYCSELVYDIYKNKLGIELCKPKKIKEYNIFGLEKLMNSRGMNLEQYVIAPCDLL